MKKKRLLITMGCSFTEGVGCWDMSITPPTLRAGDENFENYLKHPSNVKRFHEFGWPNRVGKKLGFDRVINLGKGGGSTSGQLKKFVNRILNKNLMDYETYLIFQLPEPSRFSFYKDGMVWDLMASEKHPFALEYSKNIYKLNDFLLEQNFYVTVLNEMCKRKSIKLSTFRLSNWCEDSDIKIFHREYHPFYIKRKNYIMPKGTTSPICNHHNEDGYEWVSNMVRDNMNRRYAELRDLKEVDNIEWEYMDYMYNKRIEPRP